jgi:hypothetical protein
MKVSRLEVRTVGELALRLYSEASFGCHNNYDYSVYVPTEPEMLRGIAWCP